MKYNLSPEYIREILEYNPITGLFVWKKRKLRKGIERLDKAWNTMYAGKLVAQRIHPQKGHWAIGIHCKNYMAHRIAWVHYYGEWPDKDIDHINGNASDNRIENLRLATDSENLCNAKIRTNNTSGVKGVSWSKREKKWYAYITKDKKMRSLGRYNSFKDAIIARKDAEKIFHGEFARIS